MIIKLLRDHFIFILAAMIFLTSCQMTNTGEKNISVLDKELGIEEKSQALEKGSVPEKPEVDISEKSDEKFVQTEVEPIVEKGGPFEESYENISSAQKIKDEKRILDFFSDLFKSDEATEKKPEKQNIKKNDFVKKQIVASNDKKSDETYGKEKTEIFKQEKPKDEKRILDFFTKFFESEEKPEDEIIDEEPGFTNDKIATETLNDNEEQKKEFSETVEKITPKIIKRKNDDYEETKDFKEEVTVTESSVSSSLKKIKIKEISDDLEIQDNIQDLAKNESLVKKPREFRETLKEKNIQKTNNLAFLDTRKSVYKKKKAI